MGIVGCRGLGVSGVEHRGGASSSPAWMQQESHSGLWAVLWKLIPGHQEDGMWVEREQFFGGSSVGAEPTHTGHDALFIRALLKFQVV